MTMPPSAANAGPTLTFVAKTRGAALAALALAIAIALSGCTGNGTGDATPAPASPPAPASTDPRALDTPPPDYPVELACAGVGGEVGLVLALDARGRPADVRVENTSRRPALDAAAIAAVRTWRFQPATSRGQPVATKIRVPVKFTPPTMRPDRCFALDEQQRRGQ